MRLTRPGALPDHSALEGTKLRCGVLGPCVQDESARAELRAGQILQLVARAIRRGELDVGMVMPAAPPPWVLVHGHHVGQWSLGEAGGPLSASPPSRWGRTDGSFVHSQW